MKEVMALKDSAENLNTRKSTIFNWVRVLRTDVMKMALRKTPETVRPEQLDKVHKSFFSCVCKQNGTDRNYECNLSLMILKGNQMVY